MSAREEIASKLWWSVPSKNDTEAKAGAEKMLDAYRAKVLAEAAAELDRIADIVEAGAGPAQLLRDAAGNVRYMARKDTRDGSQPPVGESADTLDFFQAGRTYTANSHADIAFDCLAVSMDPQTGAQVAVGWRYGPPRSGARWSKLAALDAASFACCNWTEGTIGGAA